MGNDHNPPYWSLQSHQLFSYILQDLVADMSRPEVIRSPNIFEIAALTAPLCSRRRDDLQATTLN